jgi:heptosyltransferase II
LSQVKSQPKTSEVREILVRAPNWIGDQVLAFPFFYQLRCAYPRAKITSVCVPWVESLQYRGLVDEVRVIRPPVRQTLFSKLKNLEDFARTLRIDQGYDLGISLPNSFSAAWLLYRAGARWRRGFRFEGRGVLLNDGLELPDETFEIQHRAESYLSLLPPEAKPRWNLNEFFPTRPDNPLDEMVPGVLSGFQNQKFWPGVESLNSPNVPYFILAPGATADSRRWPLDYFIRLLRIIYEKTGLVAVIVGGPKEAPLAERLGAVDDLKVIDFTARGPIPGLAKLFQGAKFAVTNESGLAHVSAFFGTFTQIVCGAADPRRTRPIGPGDVQVSINSVSCWPCEKNYCTQKGEQKFGCLTGITPEKVWEEIAQGLERLQKIN